MAYAYIWPPGLPQVPQKDFTEDISADVVRTTMESGISKLRYRGRSPSVLQVSFIMDSGHLTILEDFVHNTIRGVARFGFTHPRTGIIVEVRILGSGNKMYSTTYLAPGFYKVSLQLEVLP